MILIECKSPSVKIDQSVFDQISIYNLKIKSKYLMISNGLDHLYFKIDQVNKTHIFVKDFPRKIFYKNMSFINLIYFKIQMI